MRAYSALGEHGAVWIVLALALRRPRAALRVAVAYALNQGIKAVVRRPRPPGALKRTRTQLSFPSAHAATSAAAVRALPSRGLAAPAALMCLSRVYLGVHWPSDVVAGALLGTAVGR